ncbi:phosphotransferase [Massilia sp. TS11]|uniref:phosphotransferase n=1 Tax=Massilia sp. TS11 TaxID=2908003 RepID=UPI001EDB8415|nr:phosphotransferase [Massilia sp. TS11]MCG2586655.1 aminoglycoside phosphotransferase family protein [Massilia sp. TS11]
MTTAVAAFCRAHGVPDGHQATAIRAGRNSEVHRLTAPDGRVWILKRYFQHAQDPRDRLGTEYGFLSFCAEHELATVPRPLGCDREHKLALYSCLPGTRPLQAEDSHIEQAAAFIRSLLPLRAAAQALPLAADACLSVDAHLQLAQSRIARLLAAPPASTLHAAAQDFVRRELAPAEAAARAAVAASSAELPQTQQLLSPSDFGLHNSLAHAGRLGFVDFEYAGWDDPAKLICDFQCQPEIPVSAAQGRRFGELVLAGWAEEASARVAALLPLHRIKWCCILLNEFRQADHARRLHAGLDGTALLETQLDKARRYFHAHF